MRRKKKEEILEEQPVEEVKEEAVEVHVFCFEEFYAQKKEEIDFNNPCHPDWYMIGASPEQYPLSDMKLESPEEAYKKYLTEVKK
jgi:hypothetical protein